LILTLFLFCTIACEPFHLPDHPYTYFTLISAPENRLWYPEETLIFTLTEAVDPGTLSAVVLSYEDDPVHHTTVTAEENRLLVQGMLPDTVFTVTVKSALKSLSHKPFVILEEGGTAKTTPAIFTFTIGPALPSLEKVAPDSALRSASLALRFTGPIEDDSLSVDPYPTEIRVRDNLLLLAFTTPPATVTIQGLASPLRPGMVEPITLILKNEPPAAGEPSISAEATDTSVTVSVSGAGLVAASLGDDLMMCDLSCSFTKTGLTPDTEILLTITTFSTDGYRTLAHSVRTLPAAPHIMISEVMHTPQGTPEKSYEFVELYNYGDLDFDLTRCSVDDRGDGVGVDAILPLIEGDTSLAPGEFALILGAESILHLGITTHPHIFFVDDTTIADGGLTSTESVEITCPGEAGQTRAAFYNGLFRGASRGYSVIIAPDGRTCASAEIGGSPGAIEWCR